MGLGLQQLPDHIARLVDSAEIDERHGCIDAVFVRRQNRNESTTESWIRTLQQAGLPD